MEESNLNTSSKKKIIKITIIYILSLLITFLLGFFVTSQVNKYQGSFTSNFTYTGTTPIDFNEMIDVDFLSSVHEKHPGLDIDNIDINKMIKNNDFKIEETSSNTYTITTKTKYYETSFIASSQKVISRTQTFVKYAVLDFAKDKTYITFEDPSNIGTYSIGFNTYLGGGIASVGGLILTTLYFAFFYKKLEKDEANIIDNEEIFASPFHLKYWVKAATSLKDVKSIVTLAMLFSLLLVSKLFHLPSGFGDLGLGLGYIFLAIIAWIYGPIYGLVIGLLSDVLGYFIGGKTLAFNPLYTIQAMLAVFTYALCFYRTKINFSKVLLSRLIVNFILNVLYGSFLMVLMYFQAGKFESETFMYAFRVYALLYSLPKNIVYLLPQTIVLFVIFKAIGPVLGRLKYIPKEVSKNINII